MQTSKETTMKKLNVVFNGIAVAMGVAILVLNIFNPLSLTAATTLLGIGVAALGIANLRKA
jgi:VIT1/CCC1 family predicted Fe2+/Mn2+ transporter